MTAATRATASRPGMMTQITGIARSFSLAMQYKHLFQLSDQELSRQGISPDALRAQFIKDAGGL